MLVDQQAQPGDAVAAQLIHDFHYGFVWHSAIRRNDDGRIWRHERPDLRHQILFGDGFTYIAEIADALEDGAAFVHLDFHRLDRHVGSAPNGGQLDHARCDHGCSHHEDDQQHEHDVNIRDDVDFVLQPAGSSPAVAYRWHQRTWR